MDHETIAAYEAAWPLDVRMAWRDRFDPARHPDAAAALRKIVEALGIPDHCHRARCRRARRCLTPKVDCGFVHAGWIEVEIVPKLATALGQVSADAGASVSRAARGNDRLRKRKRPPLRPERGAFRV